MAEEEIEFARIEVKVKKIAIKRPDGGQMEEEEWGREVHSQLRNAFISLFTQLHRLLPSSPIPSLLSSFATSSPTDIVINGGETFPLSSITLRDFLHRYSEEAQIRSKRRGEMEREIGIYRTILRLSRSIHVHFSLPSIMFTHYAREGEEEEEEGSRYGNVAYSDVFVDRQLSLISLLIRLFDINTDRYYHHDSSYPNAPKVQEEWEEMREGEGEREPVLIIDSLGHIKNCSICFIEGNSSDHMNRSAYDDMIYLPADGSIDDWKRELLGMEMQRIHTIQHSKEKVAYMERMVANKLGLHLICASHPALSLSMPYYHWLLQLNQDIDDGLYSPLLSLTPSRPPPSPSRSSFPRLPRSSPSDKKLSSPYAHLSLFTIDPSVIASDRMHSPYTIHPSLRALILPLSQFNRDRLIDVIKKKGVQYNHNVQMEKETDSSQGQLIMEMKRALRLRGLRKSSLITEPQLTDCCIRLRSLSYDCLPYFSGVSLYVADTYRVLDDGTLLIPWDFRL